MANNVPPLEGSLVLISGATGYIGGRLIPKLLSVGYARIVYESTRRIVQKITTATASYPAYYMINCAHPTHFDLILKEAEPWMQRIRGVRANASHKSHAELDDSLELDFGDPVELGQQHAEHKRRLPLLNVMGGCCGTDQRHVEQIAATCSSLFNKRVDR